MDVKKKMWSAAVCGKRTKVLSFHTLYLMTQTFSRINGVSSLVSCAANLNTVDHKAISPLHRITHGRLIREFSDGETPLAINRDVVEARRVDMIEVLLDAGVIIGYFDSLWANLSPFDDINSNGSENAVISRFLIACHLSCHLKF